MNGYMFTNRDGFGEREIILFTVCFHQHAIALTFVKAEI